MFEDQQDGITVETTTLLGTHEVLLLGRLQLVGLLGSSLFNFSQLRRLIIKTQIDGCGTKIVFGKEIDTALKNQMLEKLYCSSDIKLDLDLIDRVRNASSIIIKVSGSDFMKKYKNRIGILHYVIE